MVEKKSPKKAFTKKTVAVKGKKPKTKPKTAAGKQAAAKAKKATAGTAKTKRGVVIKAKKKTVVDKTKRVAGKVKKTTRNTATKPKKSKATSSKASQDMTFDANLKGRFARNTHQDSSIVIVDDDMEIDQDKVNEERRAYLEEARSQEAFD